MVIEAKEDSHFEPVRRVWAQGSVKRGVEAGFDLACCFNNG